MDNNNPWNVRDLHMNIEFIFRKLTVCIPEKKYRSDLADSTPFPTVFLLLTVYIYHDSLPLFFPSQGETGPAGPPGAQGESGERVRQTYIIHKIIFIFIFIP